MRCRLSLDRAAAEQSNERVATLRQVCGRQSMDFKLVDIVAHDFMHIRASERGVPAGRVPMARALHGHAPYDKAMFNDTGQVELLRLT
jgi:hypothetical protein